MNKSYGFYVNAKHPNSTSYGIQLRPPEEYGTIWWFWLDKDGNVINATSRSRTFDEKWQDDGVILRGLIERLEKATKEI